MKNARRISVLFLATIALAACSGDSDGGNDVPSSWIRTEYSASGMGYVDSREGTSAVAKEIEDHTTARDRISDDGKIFLRYRDDIVAVTPHQNGSLIEVADYRSGYSRWGRHIQSVWPDPDSDDFRGGGPGAGK